MVSTSGRDRYSVLDRGESWKLASMLEVTAPGISYRYREDGSTRTVWMTDPDGSWARAIAVGAEAPEGRSFVSFRS